MIPELSDDVDPQVRQKLRNNPKLWVRNALKHPVDPKRDYDFRTEDGEPLTHLLHEDSWINPENWGDINVLLLARGELKSTSTGWIDAWGHDSFPQFHSYVIAPSKDQVIDFVEPIRQTYIEQANMTNRRVTDNKTSQVFKTYQRDESGDVNPIMGRLQTDSGYTEESVRGKHSQLGITDETQDLSQRVFNVFLPSIDQGLPHNDYFPTVFCIGTPKETGSFYHDLWERSDKRTWDASEGDWIQQEDVDPYELTPEQVSDLPGDIDPDEIQESYTVRGWHVDWINSPLHSMSDVARAKEQMDEMRFANEVLAQFFDPEDNLLTEGDVKLCFDEEYNFRQSPYNDGSKTILVADWGGGSDKNASDTVFMAAEEVEYDDGTSEYIVLNLEFIDEELRSRQEIRKYEEWLKKYDVDVALTDYGYGTQAMESLQNGDDTVDPDGYMDTVTAAKFGNIKDVTEIKYTEDEDENQLFFTCDKTRNSTRMVESIRDEQWVIPQSTRNSTGVQMNRSSDDGVRLINQLTAPFKTLSEGTKTGNKSVIIETPGNQRDDCFDLLTLGWLSFNEVDDDESVIDFAMNKRAGVS